MDPAGGGLSFCFCTRGAVDGLGSLKGGEVDGNVGGDSSFFC
jgi:hypothetical protein